MRLDEIHDSGKFKVVHSGSIELNGKTFTQHPVDRRSGYKLVLMDTKLLEKMWKRSGEGWVIGEGPEYENQISNRIAQFKKFYEENNNIQVGDIHIRKNGVAGFGDGRHRVRVMIEMGMKQIPISMDAESLENLMANESKGGRKFAKMLRASKKNKAKRANPKANKTNQIPYSGGGTHGGPDDSYSTTDDSSFGTRWNASQSAVNER